MIENINSDNEDPNAETAIVPFLPNLVSINQEAIYDKILLFNKASIITATANAILYHRSWYT